MQVNYLLSLFANVLSHMIGNYCTEKKFNFCRYIIRLFCKPCKFYLCNTISKRFYRSANLTIIMNRSNITKKEFQHKSLRQLVANFRNEYISNGLDENDMAADPIIQFENWFEDAVKNKVNEPNVMHLSTAASDGRPSGRIMLLKGFDESGFVFYTNYDSRKGKELRNNSYASMTFLWLELYRQVRIEGTVSYLSAEQSDEYFHSRPRGSQIGAFASAQSQILSNREQLEKIADEVEVRFKDMTIPRPENWGGVCLKPEFIEFWQGRANRLHDRIKYSLDAEGKWSMQRLYP